MVLPSDQKQFQPAKPTPEPQVPADVPYQIAADFKAMLARLGVTFEPVDPTSSYHSRLTKAEADITKLDGRIGACFGRVVTIENGPQVSMSADSELIPAKLNLQIIALREELAELKRKSAPVLEIFKNAALGLQNKTDENG